MTTGKLSGKLVNSNFWPECGNCAFFEQCQAKPKHDAFPHNWHYTEEAVGLGDKKLIVEAWVGSSVMFERHTGCYHYEVSDTLTHPEEEWCSEVLSIRREINEEDKRLASVHSESVQCRILDKIEVLNQRLEDKLQLIRS